MSTTTTQIQTTQPTTTQYTWTTGPLPLIPTPLYLTSSTDQYTLVASEMALIHNCIIRAYNSIYHQAPHIPFSEQKNFINYMLAAYQGLSAHHNGEESHFFPELEKKTGEKGLMGTNIAQHDAFQHGLEKWGKWLEALARDPSRYDGARCVELMDEFVDPLATHLADEIPSLLQLARFGDRLDLKAMTKEEAEMVMASMSKTTQLPLLLLNHDTSYEGGLHASFPPVPPAVRWLLREAYGRWNAAWWKFATCGFDGMPRELAFLGK